jgi:hypothetical protein
LSTGDRRAGFDLALRRHAIHHHAFPELALPASLGANGTDEKIMFACNRSLRGQTANSGAVHAGDSKFQAYYSG